MNSDFRLNINRNELLRYEKQLNKRTANMHSSQIPIIIISFMLITIWIKCISMYYQ